MKKVLLYIPSLTHGGAERVLSNLGNQFSRAGCKVDFILEKKVQNEYPLDSQVEVTYLTPVSDGYRIKSNLVHACELRKIIQVENPDVALAFMDRCSFQLFFATRFCRKTKSFVSLRNDPKYEFASRVKCFLVSALYPFFDGVIVQTKDAEAWMKKRNKTIKTRIIPNQVNEAFFADIAFEPQSRIVSVGRLTEQKNHELLIRAYKEICPCIDEDLYIYGEGELKEPLQCLVDRLNLNERVHFMGLVENVPQEIGGSKLFVMSSDFEGMPNALLEAMTLGIPSICTDCPCGGPREIIIDGVNGFLVPVGDEKGLAQTMKKVLSLSEAERSLITNNAKKTCELYRPKVVFEQWKNTLLGIE